MTLFAGHTRVRLVSQNYVSCVVPSITRVVVFCYRLRENVSAIVMLESMFVAVKLKGKKGIRL